MTIVSRITRIAKNDPTLTECELHRGDEPNISELAEALKTNRCLLTLNLGHNEFGNAAGEALADALKVNTVLTELDLINCRLTDIKELAESLKTNRSLLKLGLVWNQFGNAGGVALAGALKVNTVLTEIDLRNCGLVDIKELSEALKTNRSLSKLTLNSNEVGSFGGVLLAGALKVNTGLTELNLAKCSLTDIKEFTEALKTNRSLSQLDLGANKLGPVGGVALAGALQVNTFLTDINLFDCDLTDIKDLAEVLKTNRSLSKLVLHCNKFGNAGGVALAGALKINAVLTELNPCSCGLTDIKEFAESLKTNRSLSKLVLHGNKFGNAGGVAWANVLKVNTVLTMLDLSSCGLTDIKELAEVLTTNRYLTKLDLRFNNELGPIAGAALANVLKVNAVLTELNLSSCGLTDIKELTEVLKANRCLTKLGLSYNEFGPPGGVALAGALKVNTVLTELNLTSCGLSDIKELAESLKTNRSLLRLELGSNKFGSPGGVALADALKVNSTLVYLGTFLYYIDKKSQVQIDEKIAVNRSLKARTKQVNPKGMGLQTVNAATTTAGGKVLMLPPPTTAEASLDAATIAKLKALPGKHDALAREVQKLAVLDTSAMKALEGRAEQLQRMFEAEALSTFNKQEKDLIHADASLQIYYEFFARLLNGTWMACQTINSGLVANSKKDNLDYVGQGIDEIGKRIPVVSLFTGIFSGIISAWTAREKTIAVQRIALLFPDLESAFKELGQLARQLTLAQREAIVRIESQPVKLLDKVKGGAKDLKATLLGEDVKGPLKRKAVEDCEKILTAIRDEKPKASPTVADLLTVVLGANFVYKPAPLLKTTVAAAAMPIAATSRTQAGSSPQSPTTEELLERLRKMEDRDQQREAELKRMREKVSKLETQKPDEEEEVSGGNMAQAQLSASKVARRTANADPATAAAAHAEVHHRVNNVETHVAVHGARLEEYGDRILAIYAKLKQLEKGKKSS